MNLDFCGMCMDTIVAEQEERVKSFPLHRG